LLRSELDCVYRHKEVLLRIRKREGEKGKERGERREGGKERERGEGEREREGGKERELILLSIDIT